MTDKTEPSEKEEEKQTSEPSQRQYKVRLLSNGGGSDASDIQEFLRVFNTKPFLAEVSEQKITYRSQSKQKNRNEAPRPLNPCKDLYGCRRWQNSILQQPNAIMLLKLDRIKDEPVIVPLVMKELFKRQRSVLISGASSAVQRQLQAGIDLKFKSIPPMIEADTDLMSSFKDRASRRSGFQSSMRSIGELPFLSEEIREKIEAFRKGQSATLTQPETINLCLLADLCSRYGPTIDKFLVDFQESEHPISILSSAGPNRLN